ncbi:sensor histidine kinase [Actinomycetospora endophytica]|uniref:Sensor histidine kinase n=1 Tax=Actinomycetospora endophytica TaxID=2291215 RepID=A0ABS8PL71_9PSEU|nr:ATP-binding protein [Actinomycetospora endophytica]MCD2198146.1 sensor histidine kinase [Actinomycetospora endophytica]
MTSAPDRSPTTSADLDPFRHLAVVHHGVEDLLDTLAPLLRDAVRRGDLVWAAVDDATRDAIERRLGSVSFGFIFGEPGQPYSYSGQTTAARRADRLRDMIGHGRAALILSDSATVGGTDPSAPDSWSVVDASCNLALSGLPVTLVCLCDAERSSEDTERSLYWNHPELIVDTIAIPNPRYRAPAEVLASTPAPPAPALGPPHQEQQFANGTTTLRGIRAWTKRHGFEAGLDPARIDGLVLAVSELVSNSIEHGAGHGTLSWWIRPGRVVAQVHDPGHMSAITPGLRRPDALSVRGRGVWLARQLCDVLHLWTTVDGTHARLEVGV